jgi:hypothetical protein
MNFEQNFVVTSIRHVVTLLVTVLTGLLFADFGDAKISTVDP